MFNISSLEKKLPELKDASLECIQEMMKTLDTYAERHRRAKKQVALDQIRELTIAHELTFAEVVAAIRTTTKRGKAPAHYRNPANPRQTWSGKGEAPDWFKDHPEPEKLRIPGA